MLLRIICSRCGVLLFKDPHPKFNPRNQFREEGYMQHVISQLGGRCRNCGNQLRLPPKTVKIFPVEENGDAEKLGGTSS